MISKPLYFIILCLIAFNCFAGQVEEWGLEYSLELKCSSESDLCGNVLTLTNSKNEVTQIKQLKGPVLLAIANRQIISCGENSIVKTGEARIFDLSGSEVATVKHRGFLRQCGITDDGVLYWFRYSKVLDSVPANILVVVSSQGDVVYEETLFDAGDIKFIRNDKEYVLSIKAPE